MEQDLSNQSWQDIVSKCLNDLKVRFPNHSESQIADRIKISRSTFNRLGNEEKRPMLDTFLKLIIGSGNGHGLKEAIVKFDKDLGLDVLNVLQVPLEYPGTRGDNELDDLFQDRDVFVAYLLASMGHGTDRAELVEILGNSALESLKVLDRAQLLCYEGEKIHLINKAPITRCFESVRYHLTTYAKFYKTEHVGKTRNYVHSMTDGLNQQGIEKLQALHRKFHKEVMEVLREPENKGHTPMFSVAFCDSFNSIEGQKSAKEGVQ